MKLFVAFDMGNVLLPFDHMIACRKISRSVDLDPEVVYARLFRSSIAKRFELGELSPSEFLDACSKALGTDLCENTFRENWSAIFEEDATVFQIVAKIAGHARLCLVSNTNIWHFEHVCRSYPSLEIFTNRVLSYEIGCLKPEPGIYRKALEYSKSGYLNIFVDDMEENVNAARAEGFIGIHYRNSQDLEKTLQSIVANRT